MEETEEYQTVLKRTNERLSLHHKKHYSKSNSNLFIVFHEFINALLRMWYDLEGMGITP